MEEDGAVNCVKRPAEIQKNEKNDVLTVHVLEEVVLDLSERSLRTMVLKKSSAEQG